MATAIWRPGWVGGWFAPRFAGLADASRPVGGMLADSAMLAWCGIAAGALALSLSALRVVRVSAARHPVAEVTPVAALSWRRVYSRRLWLTDLMVVVWAVLGAQMAWFGDATGRYVTFRTLKAVFDSAGAYRRA
jgi:hypothetical protein